MGMTMTQKILAKHAGLASVEAGQLIEADLDLVLGNDVTTPVAIHEMEKFNKKEVFDKSKTRWYWYQTTLHRIKILRVQSIANVYVSSQARMRS